MHEGQLVFSQVTNHLPMRSFRRCVQRHQGERYVKRFRSLDQYLVMAFAQLTHRESLRDIEACLRAQSKKLHHTGIPGSDIPEHTGRCQRTTRLENPRRLCQSLIRIARPLHARKRIWDSISTIPSTLSTHPRSISASSFSLGRCSAPPSQRSNSIRCWICEEIFRPSSIFQTASYMLSMFLTI